MTRSCLCASVFVQHLDNNYLLSWCRVSWPIDNALTINFEKSSRLAYRFHRLFFRTPIRSCAISTVEGGFLVASGGPNKQFSLESRQLKFHQSQCNRDIDFSKMFWHAVKRTLVFQKRTSEIYIEEISGEISWHFSVRTGLYCAPERDYRFTSVTITISLCILD